MIRVGKFCRTEVEDSTIFHIATLESFSVLPLSEAAHVRSKTVTIAEELDAPFFAVDEEVNSTYHPSYRTREMTPDYCRRKSNKRHRSPSEIGRQGLTEQRFRADAFRRC